MPSLIEGGSLRDDSDVHLRVDLRGQQVVAGVSGLHPHHLAGLAQRLHVLAQNQFNHRSSPPVVGAETRRLKSSQVSASPSSVSPPRTNGSRNIAINTSTPVTARGIRPA